MQEPVLCKEGKRIGRFDELDVRFDCGRHLVLTYRVGKRGVRRKIARASRDASGTVALHAEFLGHEERIEIREAKETEPHRRLRVDRLHFQKLIERIITRNFPKTRIVSSAVSSDLEHSISGKHVRLIFCAGRTRYHAVAVSPWEDQPTVDSLLSAGLLWRDLLRVSRGAKVERLLLIAPAGKALVLKSRLGWMTGAGRRIHLMEFDCVRESLVFVDSRDSGNLDTALTQVQSVADGGHELQDERVQRVVRLAADAIMPVRRADHIAFRIHGLEFAQLKLGSRGKLTFGLEESLVLRNESDWKDLAECVTCILQERSAPAQTGNTFCSVQAERWLESLILRDVRVIDARLNPRCVYPQVPAFLGGDRGMIDILTVTHQGRLAILELKVSEDIELPAQGLDYWLRVRWHHSRREFQSRGYFTGLELSEAVPLLFFVCPQFRYHSSFPMITAQVSSAVPIIQVGINESWREGVRVILRRAINSSAREAG